MALFFWGSGSSRFLKSSGYFVYFVTVCSGTDGLLSLMIINPVILMAILPVANSDKLRKKITSGVSLGLSFLVATGSLTFLNDIPNTVPNFHRISQLHRKLQRQKLTLPHIQYCQAENYGGIHTVHKESWILHASTIQHRFFI